jgi:glycine cleavage system T protein (aminomethyltransferase)
LGSILPGWPHDPVSRSGCVSSRYSRSDTFLRLVSIGAMAQTLQRTPVHDRHVALGARMVPFAGWDMPVQYEGVIPEVRAVRGDCGVFDVSHMGELEVEGPRATDLLQATLSNDLARLEPGDAQYTLLTNEHGGIVDDLIVYKLDQFRYLLIVNASNRDADYGWLKEREVPGSDVRDVSDEYALLAVQGPRAIERLGLPSAKPFTFAEGEIDGVQCMVNRTGYTGEDGCELLAMAEDGAELWDRVLARGAVACGLGARDTLRLEVCYPLHGNDITPETDAISAGLAWACALDKEFTGANELRAIKASGPERKLVPFVMEEKAVPRQRMAVEGGGDVTSGTHSPMLDRGIGLAYLPAERAVRDSEISIDVRGRPRRARVVKRPIYKREESS